MTSRVPRWLTPALKAGVSIVLLVVLLARVDVGRLWTLARTASPVWLAAALALYRSAGFLEHGVRRAYYSDN